MTNRNAFAGSLPAADESRRAGPWKETTSRRGLRLAAAALAATASACGLELLAQQEPCTKGQASYEAFGSTYVSCLDPSVSTAEKLDATGDNSRGSACFITVPRSVGAHPIAHGDDQSITRFVATIAGKGNFEANSAYGSGTVTVAATGAAAANGSFDVQAQGGSAGDLVHITGTFDMKF